jgi:hypothetical protein
MNATGGKDAVGHRAVTDPPICGTFSNSPIVTAPARFSLRASGQIGMRTVRSARSPGHELRQPHAFTG